MKLITHYYPLGESSWENDHPHRPQKPGLSLLWAIAFWGSSVVGAMGKPRSTSPWNGVKRVFIKPPAPGWGSDDLDFSLRKFFIVGQYGGLSNDFAPYKPLLKDSLKEWILLPKFPISTFLSTPKVITILKTRNIYGSSKKTPWSPMENF